MDVARRDLAPSGGDSNLRLGKIFFFESDCVKHGAARRAVGAIKHEAGKGAGGVFVHRARSILPIAGRRQGPGKLNSGNERRFGRKKAQKEDWDLILAPFFD